jgi:TonB family protein
LEVWWGMGRFAINPNSMKFYFLILLLLFFGSCKINRSVQEKGMGSRQTRDSSTVFYEQGLKELNNKNYKTADSLFSLSIDELAAEDAFVNRAIARKNLGDLNGYCEDLYQASGFGKKDLKTMYQKKCCTVDTLYFDSMLQKSNSTNYSRKEIIETKNYSAFAWHKIVDNENKLLLSYEINGSDTMYGGGSELKVAEFPGGVKELLDFVKNNTHYPPGEREKGIEGTVYVKFIVNEDGKVGKINIFRGVSKVLNQEALDVVSKIPKWTPGIYKNKPVKIIYKLPMRFTLN